MNVYDWLQSPSLPLTSPTRPELRFDPIEALALIQGDPLRADGFRAAWKLPAEARDETLAELAAWVTRHPRVWRRAPLRKLPA